jgi:hypothetical protein
MAVFDKERWLALAASSEEKDQQEALDLAKDSADLIQNELLYWFACNTAFAERVKIYLLLKKEYQEKALELIDDKGSLVAFDRTETLDFFKKAEDVEMQRAIVHLERWFMKPTNIKNQLVLEYKNQKACDLDKANLEVNRLYMEEPGQAGDDDLGGGRAPDDPQY